MRSSSLFRRSATASVPSTPSLDLSSWLLLALSPIACHALDLTAVTSPDLDLSQLGRTALAGNFDAISLFTYQEQTENPPSTNGSQSLLLPLPNSAFDALASADAHILDMCNFTKKDGTFSGIIVAGNFSGLGDVESQGIASFDPTSNKVTALTGISGQVNAVLCDQDTDSVYVGGEFRGADSSNAIAYSGDNNWVNLPFAGFNGPVESIVKTSDGHIVFGGQFDGLGNTTSPTKKDQQLINLSDATLTTSSTSGVTAGFTDPKNIVCKTDGQDGAGNTWLLPDAAPGFWQATMGFGFRPTKLRLYNTHQDGRGTKTFRFTALPDNGIMNFTYTDPSTNEKTFCDARCPLTDDSTVKFQDFEFVNVVGMGGFQLDISDWYGSGAGLDGIALFQDDIYAYAVNSFNEPSCTNTSFRSASQTQGSWTQMPSGQSPAGYLSTDTSGSDTSTSVTFQPDVQQSGNYSVTIFTPGCIQDGTCASRGIVNVTGSYNSGSGSGDSTSENQIFQTNYYDKYDQIFLGRVDAASSSFRPSVHLAPAGGQGDITAVASRVRFEMIGSTGGLNGLFEYDPSSDSVDTDFSKSAIDTVGTDLETNASINSLATHDDVLFIGGNFSNSSFQNIVSISSGKASSLTGEGLNGPVSMLLVLDDTLYVSGNFSDTKQGGESALKNVASYSILSNSWTALGGGLNGRVNRIVSIPLNASDQTSEPTVVFSGDFDKILAFDNYTDVTVPGLAVWVPSKKNWLRNLDVAQTAYDGEISTSLTIDGNTTLLAGSLGSGGMLSSGAVSLEDQDGLVLEPLPIQIQEQTPQSPMRKRDTSAQNVTGVVTGLYDTTSNRNLTILAGHFSAAGADGSTVENLAMIDGTNNDAVSGLPSGLDSDSTFYAMVVQDDSLYAAGSVTGSISNKDVNGLVVYDLSTKAYVSDQPNSLEGNGKEVVVYSIQKRPDSSQLYFGGTFESASALPCPSVCFYDPSTAQWNRPGSGITGTVFQMLWVSNKKLLVAGNLTISANQTTLATYNTDSQEWLSMDGANGESVPGPVNALAPASQDYSKFWVAGKASDGSTFLTYYDGKQFHPTGNLFGSQTTVRGVQVMMIQSGHEHDSTDLVESNEVVLITGQLELPGFGNASAALYNGTALTPFVLSTAADGQPGSLSELFTEFQNDLNGGEKGHSKGIIVLIAFCLALGCVFLIVVIGIILTRIRRRRQGYAQAPQTINTDRQASLTRVPPQHLFGSLNNRASGAPTV